MSRTRSTLGDAEAWRQALLDARALLLAGLRRPQLLAGEGRALTDDDPTLLHDQFVSLRVNSLATEKLRLIDAALQRLKDGSYGICEDCGAPIPPKRLTAVPWAIYCVPCQERQSVLSDEADRAA